MQTLLTNMQAALIADSTLAGYLGNAVHIRDWNPEELPDFEQYAVVLSPGAQSETKAGLKTNELILEVLIVCLVLNFGAPAVLTGTTPPSGVGLLKFASDVKNALRGNSLAGAVLPDNDSVAERQSPVRPFPESAEVLAAQIGYRGRRRIIV